MRAKFVQALRFPRQLLKDELDLNECPHDGLLDIDDRRCRLCDQRQKCEWLYDNDEFADLSQRSLEELDDALNIAAWHMRAVIATWEHDDRSCRCDACRWLREAQGFLDRVHKDGPIKQH